MKERLTHVKKEKENFKEKLLIKNPGEWLLKGCLNKMAGKFFNVNFLRKKQERGENGRS